MPSKKSKAPRTRPPAASRVSGSASHAAFFPLLVLTLVVWVMYRRLLFFPIWFDEMIGKAIFFGFPVWLYVAISRFSYIGESFSFAKLYRGLLLGVAVGGVFGFTVSIIGLLRSGGQVQNALLFTSPLFWWEFLLALFTAFWETLFFFGWIMSVIQHKYRRWSLAQQVGVVALVFLIFHVPNTFLRFQGTDVLVQLCMLALFALGQALLFAYRRNGYALTLSHAIWGMALLVHLS